MKECKAAESNVETSIKRDNRKAGFKFAIVLILCGIGGGITGFIAFRVSNGISVLSESLDEFMMKSISYINTIIPASMLIAVVLAAAWSIHNIRQCRKNVFALIEADEAEELTRIENKLSYNLWGIDILIIFQYLMFSLMVFAGYKYNIGENVSSLFITSIVFMVGMIMTIVLQQKVVDSIRLINPEKKGSVYDMNFNRKWEESCDEAEKLIIYKAAYKAYKTVNIMCIILWIFFIVLGIVTGKGFLTVITVILIWAVLVCVYSYYNIKYSK